MFGDIPFTDRRWTQFGVKHVIKEIPNDNRVGVLTPEILKNLTNSDLAISAEQIKAMETGDYSGVRNNPPQNRDITTEQLRQWEFSVERNGFNIMVTACCLEAVADKIKPAVVYFHGGAWRMGSRKDVQNPMRLLAQFSGAIVFNVEYRLAPEYMYPCGTDDCWCVIKHIYANAEKFKVDPARIAVAGDSAGGNIAAVCARRDRSARTGMIKRQVLLYPAVTHTNPDGERDYHFSLDDYIFDDSQARWIVPSITAVGSVVLSGRNLYVNSRDEAASPDASPLLDTDFTGLPKTLIICAEFDYLTQQCRTYAKRLAEAETDTTLMIYRGTNHGFMTRVGEYPQATDLQREFAKAIADM